MERNDEATNFLLESIKNELMSIVEDKEDDNRLSSETHNYSISNGAGGDSGNIQEDVTSQASNGGPIQSYNGLKKEPYCCRNIDEDLQNMHVNLKESYELFQSIGERFENINFGCLKSRIKDLHLNDSNKDTIKAVVNDLRNSFDQKYMDNRLSDLTKEVSSKFRKHPGEFGDIPELSEFFRACAQLQHGLERLKKERRNVQDLTMRMGQVTEMSYSRVNEMQNQFKERTKTLNVPNLDENKDEFE